MRRRNAPLLAALTGLMIVASAAASTASLAAEKPEITRVDARHLDRGAVVFQIEWQSPNPVAAVQTYFGKYKKEVKIDEYGNRRNRNGYAGEATVEFALPPDVYPEGVPYIVQLEDDVRRKSDQITGKVDLLPSAKMRRPDGFGRDQLEGAAAGVVPRPQVGFGTPSQSPGGTDTAGGTATAAPIGGSGGSYGTPGMETGAAGAPATSQESASPNTGEGSGYVNLQGGQQQPYGSQQAPNGAPQGGGYGAPAQGGGGQPGSGPVIEIVQPQQIQTGETVISFQVREERGVRDISFTIYDSSNNIVANPSVQNTQPGPFWQGQCAPFALPKGFYRVLAQAYALDGSFSQKEIGSYEVKLIGQDAAAGAPRDGALQQPGSPGFSLPKVAISPPESIMKKVPGGGMVQVSNLPKLSIGGSGMMLQNDGYRSGSSVQPLPEFRAGDEVAGVLGPVNRPFQVVKVAFLCVRQSDAGVAELAIYEESGSEAPGRKIYSGITQANCAAGQLREIDLSGFGILVQGGSIRVSLKARQDGVPPIALDADGVSQQGRNWFNREGRWYDFAQAGFPGDVVMRAFVSER